MTGSMNVCVSEGVGGRCGQWDPSSHRLFICRDIFMFYPQTALCRNCQGHSGGCSTRQCVVDNVRESSSSMPFRAQTNFEQQRKAMNFRLAFKQSFCVSVTIAPVTLGQAHSRVVKWGSCDKGGRGCSREGVGIVKYYLFGSESRCSQEIAEFG